ncbi:hypothetical protein [Xylanibacter oryzae]|uniref:hypothetical protein n=1 Tax=Xylanibacter oryzae TaxID=185293 RepID=UPI0004ACC548|nr:hypothetical protein [Xylanibacter oryzae]
MEWPNELLKLFDDPILDNVRPKAAAITADDRRVKTLLEIADWSEANGNRIPQNDGDLKEKIMARSLAALRRDKSAGLEAYDRLNLLKED